MKRIRDPEAVRSLKDVVQQEEHADDVHPCQPVAGDLNGHIGRDVAHRCRQRAVADRRRRRDRRQRRGRVEARRGDTAAGFCGPRAKARAASALRLVQPSVVSSQ